MAVLLTSVLTLSKMLFAYHTLQTTGGLTTYVDRYQALMAEMDTIAPFGYDDGKKQLLVKNVRHTLEWHTWHSGARMMPVICHVC
jgi:hypothetical protein